MPALHRDALVAIAESTYQRRTILSLMLTCRALYEEGARLILRDVAQIDGDPEYHWGRPSAEETVKLFLRFMEAEGGRRWLLLRKVSLHERILPESGAALVSGLRQASFMEHLELWHSERTLRSLPGLAEALLSLKHITYLRIDGRGRRASMLLQEASWPIKAARIGSACTRKLREATSVESERPRAHPVVALESFRGTLTTLFYPRNIDRFPQPSSMLTYPMMRELHAELSDVYEPDVWFGAFPHLTHISLFSRSEYQSDRSSSDSDYQGDGSSSNATIRRARNARNTNKARLQRSGSWDGLELLDGYSPMGLFMLGLTCRVKTIRIRRIRDPSCLSFLPKLLEHSRPTELITVTTSELSTTFCETVLQSVKYLGNLRTLEINVTLSVPDFSIGIEHTLHKCTKVVSSLPKLHKLILTFQNGTLVYSELITSLGAEDFVSSLFKLNGKLMEVKFSVVTELLSVRKPHVFVHEHRPSHAA